RQGVDVLRGAAVHSEAQALDAILALLEIVLAQPEAHGTGDELHPLEGAVLLPRVLRHEAEHVAIEGEALLDVVHGQARPGGAQPQALGLLAVLESRLAPGRFRSLARGLRRLPSRLLRGLLDLPRDLALGLVHLLWSLLRQLRGLLGRLLRGLLR